MAAGALPRARGQARKMPLREPQWKRLRRNRGSDHGRRDSVSPGTYVLEIRRLVSRSIERREFLHLRRILFLRNKFLSETGEPAQAFGLRAAAQKCALEIQVVDGFGELEAHVGVLWIGLR